MNAIESRQQFKYEYIAGVSLSNDLPRLKQTSSNVNTNKERQVFYTTQNQISSIPVIEQSGKQQQQQLEIIGSEFGPKSSNHQLLIKDVYSPTRTKFKLSRVDQRTLQLPKRTTYMTNRKAQNSAYPRMWTTQVSHGSNLATSNELVVNSSNRRGNTAGQSSDDSNMKQQTQNNSVVHSSITIIKKLPTTNNPTSPKSLKTSRQPSFVLGRDLTSLKLPALSKKTSPTVLKSIPTAYIQDSSRSQLSSSINRSVLQPARISPIFTSHRPVILFTEHHHLPLIKDRIIKANLAQKANLKCKSPSLYRTESSLSRSTTAVVTTSQLQMKHNNPLKHMATNSLLNEADRNKLKRLFQQLDTDKDGHLTYSQVQKCLPSNLPRAQETFFRALYEITSDITYFGLEEFYTVAILVNLIGEQDLKIWKTLLDDVDFNYYHDDILELLNEFDHRYSSITSTITFENFVALIMNGITNGKSERITEELENLIPTIKTMKLTRVEFIALIPVIIYIEALLDHGKSLFRFRDNSILNSHIQKALST